MGNKAAALVIGNELLSGKIQDENIQFLGAQLYGIGITLEKVVLCLDDVNTIANELNALRTNYSYVFTSGGVGPTHDDVTLTAVAKAFNTEMVRFTEIESLIRNFYKAKVQESHLRMADAPEGAKLVSNQEVPWPTVQMDNVFVLPGIPEIFRKKFSIILPLLKQGDPIFSTAVFVKSDEGQIAEILKKMDDRYPEVQIGSYPNLKQLSYRVKVTFDGKDQTQVESAKKDFMDILPRSEVVKTS